MTNDHLEPIEDASVSWELVSVETAEVAAKNGLTMTIPADAAQVADRISWPIPEDVRPGSYRVDMQVAGADGRPLSTNATEIVVR